MNGIKACAIALGMLVIGQAALPAGSGDNAPPENMVTTDTAQTVTGSKLFSANQIFDGGVQNYGPLYSQGNLYLDAGTIYLNNGTGGGTVNTVETFVANGSTSVMLKVKQNSTRAVTDASAKALALVPGSSEVFSVGACGTMTLTPATCANSTNLYVDASGSNTDSDMAAFYTTRATQEGIQVTNQASTGTSDLYSGYKYGAKVFEVQTNGRLTITGGLWSKKRTLTTCASTVENLVESDTLAGGAATGKRSKLCLCTSDGAGNYAWQNIVTGTVGTTTTCGTE